MTSLASLIERLPWADIGAQLDAEGHAVLPGLLGPEPARGLARQADTHTSRRLPLAAAGLGRGEMLDFGESLPQPWAAWRTAFYPRLAGIANRWSQLLGSSDRYPAGLEDFLRRNRMAGQLRPQSHLTRLAADDYLALHRRDSGEHVFPLQLVALLSEPGRDFQGGEFVITEQRPRMQSRPTVLPLALGDAALIATGTRPFQGSRGHYQVKLKHAISRVRQGQRIGVELSFHNAP